jgi:hypothetical protein
MSSPRKPGPKTAKKLAVIIEGRHGLRADSYYSLAGCLTCRERCSWPSFSLATPADLLPTPCLSRVTKRNVQHCFYNFHGRCLVDYERELRGKDGYGCVLEQTFLADAFPGYAQADRPLAELAHRRRMVGFREEAARYVRELRRRGRDQFNWRRPRAVHVLRRLARLLQMGRTCKYEHSPALPEILEWLALSWNQGA